MVYGSKAAQVLEDDLNSMLGLRSKPSETLPENETLNMEAMCSCEAAGFLKTTQHYKSRGLYCRLNLKCNIKLLALLQTLINTLTNVSVT
jgi:hypothetical protein